jgi:Transglycosylase SLT domain
MATPRLHRACSRLLPLLAILGIIDTAQLTSAGDILDRIAYGVDGAESSHGGDPGMWRPEPDGPQGPMQVSAAAAADVGGGDRFDETENRALGRAYLAHMFRRYGSWPDAIAAYNWGPGHLDEWIGGGRPADKFPAAVERYRARVLGPRDWPLGPISGWQGSKNFVLKPNASWLSVGVAAEGRTQSSCCMPKSCDPPRRPRPNTKSFRATRVTA